MNPHRLSLLVARRELRDSLTDWRILTPVALLTFIFPWLVIYATEFGIGYAERYDPELVLTRLIPFALMVVGFFPISFSLVIALESFVGEKERNSLESLLSTPITDGALYVGKLLAALALPLAGSYLAMALYAFGLPWITDQSVPGSLLIQIFLLTTMLALGMVAGAVVVSSNTTSVRAANLLASFIVIPAMLIVQFQALVILWDQQEVLWYVAVAMATADLALIRMGTRLFNREELLSRTVDRIDIRRAWRTFWAFMRQEPLAVLRGEESAPLTLGRLYRRDLPQLLRRNAGAAVTVLLVLTGAFLIGWTYSQALPLPAEIGDELTLDPAEIRQTMQELQQLGGINPMLIFGWNAFYLSLAALFGLLSFGMTAVVPLFTTIGIIGFGAGELVLLNLPLGPFALFLWPHGVIEIPAAILATAAGLRMGAAVLAPPKGFTLGETLLQGLADFVKILFLLILPLLLVAALIEVYLTTPIALWFLGG